MSGSSPTLHQLYLANSGRPHPLRLEKAGADRPCRLSDFGAVGDRQLVERTSRYDRLARVPDAHSADLFLTAVPPEVPADPQRDHLWREPKPGEGRPSTFRPAA